MRIGSAITANYLWKAEPFLNSLKILDVPTFCIAYGFKVTPALRNAYPWTEWYELPSQQPGDCSGCIQYGAWLRALPPQTVADNELLIFVDSDAVFQRNLLADEIQLLTSIDQTAVGLGYNAGPQDTLQDEMRRVYWKGQEIPWRVAELLFPGITTARCFNCGCIVARYTWWQQLLSAYEDWYPGFQAFVGPHAAKIQTLICWLIQKVLNSTIVELPYSFHMQGHYPLPPGGRMSIDPPAVCYNDRLVWYAHHFPMLLGWGN